MIVYFINIHNQQNHLDLNLLNHQIMLTKRINP